MTNQTPPSSRPPRDERQDELIAVLVALGAIGTIFFWGFNRLTAPKVALLDGGATSELGDRSDSFLADGEDTGLELAAGPLGGVLGEGQGDDGTVALDTDGADGPLLDPTVGAVGTAVGGSVLLNSGDAEAKAPDAEADEVDADTADADEGLTDDTAAGVEDAEPEEVEEVEPPELAVQSPEQAFPDIDADYWASPFIEGLRQKDIATGFVDGNFEPEKPVSRSQFASLIARTQNDGALPKVEDAEALSYSDLPQSHPQFDAVGQVTKSGFMNGYPEGDFRPNDSVSKLEVLVAIISGLELDAPSDPEGVLQEYYGDVDQIPDWAYPKLAAATEAGIVVNHNDLQSLKPERAATRAEAAAMLYQALVSLDEAEAVDSEFVVQP